MIVVFFQGGRVEGSRIHARTRRRLAMMRAVDRMADMGSLMKGDMG